MKHKLGVIGYGYMASAHHCKCFVSPKVTAHYPDNEIGGVFDIRESAREEAKAAGYPVFESLDDFFASHNFDIVLVATPNNTHCEYAMRAMREGYHVIVEKPAAIYPAELEEAIEVSKETGKLFTVHQNRRWDADFLMVKQALERGLIGKPYMIESRIHSDGLGMYGWRGYETDGGGMLRDWGVHMLDQLLYLVDEPIVAVSAQVNNLFTAESDDYAKINIRFESGLAAQVEVSQNAFTKLPRWVIYGDKGAFRLDTMQDCPKIRRIKKASVDLADYPTYLDDGEVQMRPSMRLSPEYEEFDFWETGPSEGWATPYINLLDAIEGKAELIIKPEQALRVLKVIEAAFRYTNTVQCKI